MKITLIMKWSGVAVAALLLNLVCLSIASRYQTKLRHACDTQAMAAVWPRIQEAERLVGAADEVKTLHTHLTRLVKQDHLESAGIVFTQLPGKGRYQSVGFSIPVAGPYPQVRRFIAEVEQLRALLTIQSLHLTRTQAESGYVGIELRAVTVSR